MREACVPCSPCPEGGLKTSRTLRAPQRHPVEGETPLKGLAETPRERPLCAKEAQREVPNCLRVRGLQEGEGRFRREEKITFHLCRFLAETRPHPTPPHNKRLTGEIQKFNNSVYLLYTWEMPRKTGKKPPPKWPKPP